MARDYSDFRLRLRVRSGRMMLEEFNAVRNNAVHHGAQAVKSFDLVSFANQLWRAQWIWLAQVALVLKIKIPAESLFVGKQCVKDLP